jgi:hypothetical protein
MMRSVRILAVLTLLALASPPATRAEIGAQSAGADKSGWWYRFQGPQEGEPADNPVRRAIPPNETVPSTVPRDAIAVGAFGGQPDKVAAVGIVIDEPAGTLLLNLTLTMRESTASNANSNAAQARVFACPITDFWAPTQTGRWVDRPAADCNRGKITGQRAPDGTWTFDLALLGILWLAKDGSLSQNGVRLEVDPASGQGIMQVSWTMTSIAVSTQASPPASTPAPTPFVAPVQPSVDVPVPPDTTPVAAPPVAPAEALPTVELVQPTRAAVQLGDPNLFGDLPWAALLLIPLLAGLALLVGFVLGPAGEPQTMLHREGAVSRALARREAASKVST